MKRCPECRRDYPDETLNFCLEDGSTLVSGPTDEPVTAILSAGSLTGESPTQSLDVEASDDKPKLVSRFRGLLYDRRIAFGALALIAVATLGYSFSGRSPANGPVVRLSFEPPAELRFNDTLPDAAVISPDGQKIAFTAAATDGKTMLYIRGLDSSEAKLLPGSDNAIEPFWSPDSRSIAYGSNGKLKRSDLSGGNAQILCDSARMTGGAWNKDGVIIFGPDYRTRLMQIPAKGGEPQSINFDFEDIENERTSNPVFLPDGRNYLFRRLVGGEMKGIWAGSLDSPAIKQLLPDNSNPVYSQQGWLAFIRNGDLVAQAFDASNVTLSGEPQPVVIGQANAQGYQRRFSVSDNGVLIWQGQWERDYQLLWFDREGKQIGAVDAPMKVSVGQDPHISPDGKRLAIKKGIPQNIWVVDLEKGTSLRITSTFAQNPVWSPDGSRIAFNGDGGIGARAANGTGDVESLFPGTNFPDDWSPDGRFLIFRRRGERTRFDMYALSMDGERKDSLLLNSAFDELGPQFSPDGKWLAYPNDETGDFEIYVQSFSADGKLGSDRKRISTAGGRLPVWRRDGGELFFVAADGRMMSTMVKTTGGEFQFTTPTALFKTRMLGVFGGVHEFDVSPDGQRFLIGTLIGEPTAPPPTVILNWTAALKK